MSYRISHSWSISINISGAHEKRKKFQITYLLMISSSRNISMRNFIQWYVHDPLWIKDQKGGTTWTVVMLSEYWNLPLQTCVLPVTEGLADVKSILGVFISS